MNYVSKYALPSLPAGAEFEPKDDVYYQSIQKGSCKCHLYFKKAVVENSGWFTEKEDYLLQINTYYKSSKKSKKI